MMVSMYVCMYVCFNLRATGMFQIWLKILFLGNILHGLDSAPTKKPVFGFT